MAAAAAFAAGWAAAADPPWPQRPVRVLVPAPPGGTVDLVGRLLAPRLAEQTGQAFVVDNRAGAGGVIATELLARALPDGYTILVVYTPFTTNAAMRRTLPYDPVRDVAAVTQVSASPLVLVAHPGLPAQSVRDLVAMAKAKPLLYGSAGSGSGGHMCGELFNVMAGIRVTHVPYKGAALATNEVVAGQVAYQFAGPITVVGLARAGRLRMLGVSSLRRTAALPDVPTVDEQGVPGFEVINWFGLVAPARTPAAIVQRLHAEVAKALAVPEVRGKLVAEAAEIVASPPAAFAEFIRRDLDKWRSVVARGGIQVE